MGTSGGRGAEGSRPGVFGLPSAHVVTLEAGQEVRVGTPTLGPRLRKRWVTGFVAYPDGTLATHATVEYAEVRPEHTGLRPLRTRTDAWGRFMIELYEGRTYQFTALARRRPPPPQPLPEGGIRRSAGGAVSGVVVGGEHSGDLVRSAPVRTAVRAGMAPLRLTVVDR